MQILNPRAYSVGGLVEVQTKTQAARKQVDEMEIQVRAQRKKVSEGQMQLDTQLNSLQHLITSARHAEETLNNLQSEKETLAKSKADNPTGFSTTDQTRLDALEGDEGEISKATKTSKEAKEAKEAQGTTINTLLDVQQELEEKLSTARAYLQTATEIESMAYAYARDNQPFWVAPAIGNQRHTQALKEYEKLELEAEQAEGNSRLIVINEELGKTPGNEELTDEKTALETRLGKIPAELEKVKAELIDAKYIDSWRPNTDGVNKVFMFAFEDRATIILRGKAEHIFQAKQVIKKFDVPAPQARLTLWTLELNSKATTTGARRMNEAMQVVEREFNLTRTQTDAVLSIFKDVIAEEVNRVARDHKTKGLQKAASSFFNKNNFYWQSMQRDDVFARYLYYEPDVLKEFGCFLELEGNGLNTIFPEIEGLEHNIPFSGKCYCWECVRKVLCNALKCDHTDSSVCEKTEAEETALGLQAAVEERKAHIKNYYNLMPSIIPDPAAISTLGEAMLVFCLGNIESRHNIFAAFQNNLQSYLTWLCDEGHCNCFSCSKGKKGFGDCYCDCEAKFFRTIRAFGMDGYAGVNQDPSYPERYTYEAFRNDQGSWPHKDGGLNGKQAVIVDAIKRHHLRDMLGAAGALLLDADQQRVEMDQLISFFLYQKHEIDNPHSHVSLATLIAKETADDEVIEFNYSQEDYNDAVDYMFAQTTRPSNDEIAKQLIGDQTTVRLRFDELKYLQQRFGTLGEFKLADKIIPLWLSYLKNKDAASSSVIWVSAELGTDPNIITDILKKSFSAERDKLRASGSGYDYFNHLDIDQAILRKILDRVYEQYVGDNEYAMVARADEMLKGFNKAMEDDIDAEFIQPMLGRLREQILQKGVAVGVLQRTSMFTTNRKESRIIPKASAEFRMGETTDYLAEVKILAQLVGQAKTGDVLGLIDKTSQLAKYNETTEIYGISTGNRFTVTPIFDPTGQAYRFQLDHVYSNLLREPDGTTAKDSLGLPRIESMVLNTEVQLSNFELREVARYETNVKLGQTERRRGGLPIFRHDPLLKNIPLIGYFTRKKGEAAVTQTILTFAQTTMYPTIGEIIPLMTTPLFVVSDRQY